MDLSKNKIFLNVIDAENLLENCLRLNPPIADTFGDFLSFDPSKVHSCEYYTAITLDPNKYAVDGTFTKYDCRVFNGCCSLFEAENRVFTAEMVYRAMNGLPNAEKVTAQQAAAVTKSLNKQRNINIEIEIVDIDWGTTTTVASQCLEVQKATIKGDPEYRMLSKPILYAFSKWLNQITSIPSKVLTVKDEAGERIRNTDDFTVIREYLLMRIEEMNNAMKHEGGEKSTVMIDINTFYSETDTNTAATKATTKAREQARLCLEYWKSINYISGYEFVKENPKSKNSPVTKLAISL